MSQKASDYSCIPLTHEEHQEYHRLGRGGFESLHQIDCANIARQLNAMWREFAGLVK